MAILCDFSTKLFIWLSSGCLLAPKDEFGVLFRLLQTLLVHVRLIPQLVGWPDEPCEACYSRDGQKRRPRLWWHFLTIYGIVAIRSGVYFLNKVQDLPFSRIPGGVRDCGGCNCRGSGRWRSFLSVFEEQWFVDVNATENSNSYGQHQLPVGNTTRTTDSHLKCRWYCPGKATKSHWPAVITSLCHSVIRTQQHINTLHL